jgi:hypothetical protein
VQGNQINEIRRKASLAGAGCGEGVSPSPRTCDAEPPGDRCGLDARLQAIYDNTPLDEPRSKLEPYRELILLWRRQKRTYRRIQELLGEKCGVSISIGQLHKFVRSRARPRKEVDLELTSQPDEIRTPTATQGKPVPAPEQQNKVDRWAAERERMTQHKAEPVIEQKPWWKPQLEFTDEDAVKPLYSASKKEEK